MSILSETRVERFVQRERKHVTLSCRIIRHTEPINRIVDLVRDSPSRKQRSEFTSNHLPADIVRMIDAPVIAARMKRDMPIGDT